MRAGGRWPIGAGGATLSLMRLHLLLLDRDAERRQSVAELLRGAGHQVLGTEAAGLVAEMLVAPPGDATPPFDALVLDLSHPGLDLAALREAIHPESATPPDSLEAAERRQIVRALQHTEGNKRRAALVLGISRSTLLNKIRRYAIA